MPNPWIVHVKKVQAEKGLSYKEAMKEAKKTYVPNAGKPKAGTPKAGTPKAKPKARASKSKKGSGQCGDGVLDDIEHFVKKKGKKILKAERKVSRAIVKAPENIYKGVRKEAIHLLKSRPQKLKNFMKSKRGKMRIKHIEVCRTPVVGAIQSALNLVSKNAFKQEQQKKSYDDMYHLYMVMTFEDGKQVSIEKNDVLKIGKKPEKREHSECKSADVNTSEALTPKAGMVFNDMMVKAEEIHPNLYRYTAWKYNCQDFIFTLISILGASHLKDFVLQDFTGAFKGNKRLKRMAISITDASALGKRILFGAGASEPTKKELAQHRALIRKLAKK